MLRKELTCFGGRESVNYFARVLPRMLEDTPGDVHRYYVASLSKKRNDLGQWRAYADNGHGFMIGFAPELFQVSSNADNMNEKYFVVRVNYDRAQVASRHREVIRMALQAMRRAPQTEWRLITVEAALLLLIGSVLAKHQGYGIEDEIRLVLVNELRWVAPCIKTRARGTSLVPFVDCELLKYSSRPITEIMIGPTGKSNARDAVKQLLANQEATSPTGCPGPPVIRSLIPYQTP